MSVDWDVGGVLVPSLLGCMLVAFALSAVLRRVLAWGGVYRFVWHRALFDAALYVVLLGAVFSAGLYWVGS